MVKIEQKGKVTCKRAIKDFFCGYIDFKGRTTRAGYWWVMLILTIVTTITGLIAFSSLLRLVFESEVSLSSVFWALLFLLLIVIILIPSLSLTIRRNRDTGVTGWGSFCLYFILFMSQSINYSLDYVTEKVVWEDNILLTFLSFVINVFLFLLTIFPTDTLTIRSENKILRFFFRTVE